MTWPHNYGSKFNVTLNGISNESIDRKEFVAFIEDNTENEKTSHNADEENTQCGTSYFEEAKTTTSDHVDDQSLSKTDAPSTAFATAVFATGSLDHSSVDVHPSAIETTDSISL
jgi:hypothetical protein